MLVNNTSNNKKTHHNNIQLIVGPSISNTTLNELSDPNGTGMFSHLFSSVFCVVFLFFQTFRS